MPSAMPNSDKPERRKVAPRSRALLSGKLVFDNANQTMDCLIRDVTKDGAKVKMTSAVRVPSRVFLIDIKRALGIDCHVIWARPPELGLKFLKSHNLQEESSDPQIRGLRRIWVELAAR
ncbi:MAG: PilZ domain-containing protein [Caulobacterales bacterium]